MAWQATRPERTRVSVPAAARQVRVLRLVTASTMSLHEFGADVVEDARSAVAEACALLLGDDDASGQLELTLQSVPERIEIVIRGDFERPPLREATDGLRPELLLLPFVDACEVDLEHDCVSFSITA